MVRPIINSEKRIVQITLTNIGAGANGTNVFVEAVQDVIASNPTHVSIGSVVKAVYVEMWLLGDGQQPNTATTIIQKLPDTSASPTALEMADLNAYAGKKNILELHQGLLGDANTNPVPFYRGWIKIPKGKQRFGLGDRMSFTVKAITEGMQYCGVFIYKVYN